MSVVWDFFSTLFHWWKTQSNDTAENNYKKNQDKIEWYADLNWEKVMIVSEETSWEQWANRLKNAWNVTTDFFGGLIDKRTVKQEVDSNLVWLRYDWQQTTDAQKTQYINRLSEAEALKNKESWTLEDSINARFLENELNKYTVPDTMTNNSLDDWWFWYDSLWWRLFMSDNKRDRLANQDTSAKRVPVDREMLINTLNKWLWSQNTWWQYQAKDPDKVDWSQPQWGMRVMTREKFIEEQKRWDIDNEINTLLDTAADTAIKNNFIAPWNPWWRQSTKDEVLGLFEAAMQDRSIQTNLEAYKEFYAEIKWKAPELEKYVKQKAVDLVDMMTYILTANTTSKEAYEEYVRSHENPYNFDVAKLDYSKLNNYEKNLLYLNPMTTARVAMDATGLDDDIWWSPVDAYYTVNSMIRAAKIWKNVSEWKILSAWWNTLEWVWAAAGWLVSSALWTVCATTEAAASLITEWKLDTKNFESYMFWWQSSSIYNMKWNYQKEWEEADFCGSDVVRFVRQYASVADDLVTARLIMKLDMPVKIADLAMVNKVLATWKKLEKAVDVVADTAKWASKVAKATDKAEDIITWAEKMKKAIDSQTFFWRTKNAIKNLFSKDEELAAAKKAISISTKDSVMLAGKNIANWIADEAITSAVFQWMTPYTYSQEDLALDVFWGVFSGLIRVNAFNNRMWLFKKQAMDQVWAQWYLTEIWVNWKWMWMAEAADVISKMNPANVSSLWRSIKEHFYNVLDADTLIKKWWLKSKASLLSDAARWDINKLITDTVHHSEQRLMKQLSSSMDSKYSSLVKKWKVTLMDWTVTSWYVWNKPKWMSSSKFEKIKRQARDAVYSPKGLNDINTIKWRSEMLNKIKKYVRDKLPQIAARWSKETRAMVEKWPNWKWRFKKWVSKEKINALYSKRLQMFIDRSPYRWELTVKWNKLLDTKTTWMWFSAIDYIKNPMWPFWQRVAMYINDMIKAKNIKKTDLLSWLSFMWAWVYKTFKRWLKETYNIWDYTELTTKQLASYMMEFAHALDERIFPDFIRRAEQRQAWSDVLSDDKKYLSNMTYEDAVKQNPDLAYMSPEMFHEICNDDLSLLQKEIKLRWFKRKVINDKHIYWINPWKKRWVQVFWDTYEEKKFMWKSWTIYIKWNKRSWQYMVDNMWKKKAWEIPVFDRKWDWVNKFTYTLSDTDTRTGKKTYSIYKWNAIVWYIYTKWDYELWKWETPWYNEMYSTERVMTVELFDSAVKWDYNSVEFEIVKNKNSFQEIQKYDISEKLPDDKNVVTEKMFDKEIWTDVPETTLAQWNDLQTFIRKWWQSYNEFVKLVPWYTDRISEAYFNMVMKEKDFRDSDKINMFIWAMFNKSVRETPEWFLFDLTKRKTFNRQWYSYYKQTKTKTWESEMRRVYVASDSEIFYDSIAAWWDWVVLLKMDWDSVAEQYYYKKSSKDLEFEIYKTKDDKKPIGVISFWSDRIRWYVYKPGWPRIISWSVEFLHSSDEWFVAAAYSKRYWETTGKIIVDESDEMYKEIYKEMYWKEMPDWMYYKLKNTPNMTPEKYLESLITNIRWTKFWKFINIKWANRKNVIHQIKLQQPIIDACNWYVKLFWDTTTLTDVEIYKAAEVYIDRLKKWNWTITLSKAEQEVKDIIYWNLYQYWPNNMINILWYQMFWKNPPSDLWDWSINKRLRNRRDTILMAIYKDKNAIDSWSDQEKMSVLNRIKRMRWDVKRRQDISIDDIKNDIALHPEEYNAIIDALQKRIDQIDRAKNKLDAEQKLEIDAIEKRIAEIEKNMNTKKPMRTKSADTDAISMKNFEAKQDYLSKKLNDLIVEKERIAEEVDPVAMEEINRKIDAVLIAKQELEENIAYMNWKKAKEFTDEEFSYLVNRQIRWEQIFEPWRMTDEELNERLQFLTSDNRLAWMRILRYDPRTWTINADELTQAERAAYKDALSIAADDLANGRARATHIWWLHAMVIDPTNVNVFDISHESFHEACNLMVDQKYKLRVFDEAYAKFKDQIDEFAESRWYDELFKYEWYVWLEYQRAIAEEWLAERFAEYVMWRLELENSTIMKFFKQLWDKIRLLFSDTEAIKLFDDIYEWRLQYNEIKIDLNPWDIKTNKLRVLNSDTLKWIDNNKRAFWDEMSFDSITSWVWLEQARLLANTRITWFWNYFSSMRHDWWFSFDDMYEKFILWSFAWTFDNVVKFISSEKQNFTSSLAYNWKPIRSVTMNNDITFEAYYDRYWSLYKFEINIPQWWQNKSLFHREINDADLTIWKVYDLINSKYKEEIYNAIQTRNVRSTQDYLQNVLKLPFEISDVDYKKWAAQMNSDPNTKGILDTMADKLEKSVDTYVTKMDDSFNWYENIKEIKDILDRSFKTQLFNRLIPHTHSSWIWKTADIFEPLRDRKIQRTMSIINDIDKLKDNRLTYKIWLVVDDSGKIVNNTPVVTISFKDNKWSLREIWWHITEESITELYNQWLSKYDSIKSLKKNKQFIKEIPWRNQSLLYLPEWTKIVSDNWYVWKSFDRRVREANSKSILFNKIRSVPYKLWWTTFNIDDNLWVVIQKNMTTNWFLAAIDNWWWISSSLAILDKYRETNAFWEVSLIWRKVPTAHRKELYEWIKIFWWDAYTPTVTTLIYWDIKLMLADAYWKYLNWWEWEIADSLRYELNDNLKWYFKDDNIFLDKEKRKDAAIVNLMRRWDEWDMRDYNNKIFSWIRRQLMTKLNSSSREAVITKLMTDEDYMNRIYDNAFEWQLVWFWKNADDEYDDYIYVELKNIDNKYLNMINKDTKQLPNIRPKNKFPITSLWLIDIEKITDSLRKNKNWDNIEQSYLNNRLRETDTFEDYIESCLVSYQIKQCFDYFEWYTRKLDFRDYWWVVTNNLNHDAIIEKLKDKWYKYHVIDPDIWYSAKEMEDIIDKYTKEEKSFIVIKWWWDIIQDDIWYYHAEIWKTEKWKYTADQLRLVKRRWLPTNKDTYTYDIWWIKVTVPKESWLAIQKWISVPSFIDILDRWYRYWSSFALKPSFGNNIFWWEVSSNIVLVWRKVNRKTWKKIFENTQLYSWDAHTPTTYVLAMYDIIKTVQDTIDLEKVIKIEKELSEANKRNKWKKIVSSKFIEKSKENLSKKLKELYWINESFTSEFFEDFVVLWYNKKDWYIYRLTDIEDKEWYRAFLRSLSNIIELWGIDKITQRRIYWNKDLYDYIFNKLLWKDQWWIYMYSDWIWIRNIKEVKPLHLKVLDSVSSGDEYSDVLKWLADDFIDRLNDIEDNSDVSMFWKRWELDVNHILKNLSKENAEGLKEIFIKLIINKDPRFSAEKDLLDLTNSDVIESLIIAYRMQPRLAYLEWYQKEFNMWDWRWWVVNSYALAKLLEEEMTNRWFNVKTLDFSRIDKLWDSWIKLTEDVIDNLDSISDKSFVIIIWWKDMSDLSRVNRRMAQSNLSDKTIKLLNDRWLYTPIIWVSTNRYLQNNKHIDSVLSEYNYNMRKDSPDFYEQKKELLKKYKVRDKQTWNNSKTRIMNKEYRDLQRRLRYLQEDMEIRQEEYDEFLESPIYYQASKIKEAIESSEEIRKSILESRRSKRLSKENSTSFAIKYEPKSEIIKTTDSRPPFAKEILNDKYYHIDQDSVISDYIVWWDEYLAKNIDNSLVNERAAIWWEVDIIVPVWENSISDYTLFDDVFWARSFAIWATDSKVLNDIVDRIENEMPWYVIAYERKWSNILYYIDREYFESDWFNIQRKSLRPRKKSWNSDHNKRLDKKYWITKNTTTDDIDNILSELRDEHRAMFDDLENVNFNNLWIWSLNRILSDDRVNKYIWQTAYEELFRRWYFSDDDPWTKLDKKFAKKIAELNEREQRVWYRWWKRIEDHQKVQDMQNKVDDTKDKILEQIMEEYAWQGNFTEIDQYWASEKYAELESWWYDDINEWWTRWHLSSYEKDEMWKIVYASKRIDEISEEYDYLSKIKVEKQIEEDKNITEASLWSMSDSSLVCKI